MLEIEIDGKKAQVPDGSTVMDAAQQVGVYIPHFCYHKKLSIAANCRMCLVQVEKAPKPLPACATPVTNGMKVFTHSALAAKAQKGVMEFLLINHPLDCPICDQGGECQLQDLAVGYGPTQSRYQEEKRVVFHKNVGPLISMEEMSRCIHCTRCVRFGQEVAGVMELGMASRNMHSEITTFLGRTVDSELSGNMIDLCPVGALTSKPFRYTARSWELQRRRSVSPHDSLGSNLVVQVKHDQVMRVLPFENDELNECWISDKDRFSYLALSSEQRLLKPQVKQGGEWKEADWNVALDYAAHGLRDVVREHGADEIAALVSPHSTLEEAFLLNKIVAALGSGNIDSRLRQTDFAAESADTPWLGMQIAELNQLDSVLLVGSNLRKEHPLIAQRLRQAAKKYLTVNSVSCVADDQLMQIDNNIVVSVEQVAQKLAAVALEAAKLAGKESRYGAIAIACTAAKAIAESLTKGEKSAVLIGNLAQHSQNYSLIRSIAAEIAELTNTTLGIIPEAANTVGSQWLFRKAAKSNMAMIMSKDRAAYVLFGLDPECDTYNAARVQEALKQAKLVVAFSAFKSAALLETADVLLPITPFTETSGTFVNAEGRVQGFSGVAKPLGQSRPGWKVLRVLANVINLPGFDFQNSEEVKVVALGGNVETVNGLGNQPAQFAAAEITPSSGFIRIGDVPIHFADPISRRSAVLKQTTDSRKPAVRINAAGLQALNLKDGDSVRVSQGNAGNAVLTLVLDDKVPNNNVRISAAHELTAQLGGLFDAVTVERA